MTVENLTEFLNAFHPNTNINFDEKIEIKYNGNKKDCKEIFFNVKKYDTNFEFDYNVWE